MSNKYNPTAAQIASFTATARQAGKKWVHQLFNEAGELIATRKTEAPTPYAAACILVVTKNSRIAYLKREASKSHSKSFAKSCREDVARLEAEIADGADGNQYHGCEITWTRGAGSGGYSAIIARLVPARVISK